MHAHMQSIFKNTDNLIGKLKKFVALTITDLKRTKFESNYYNQTLDSLFKDIWDLEQSLYKYWSIFKYENDYWCERSLMRATKELKSAQQILSKKITLTTFRKFSDCIYAAHFFIDYKFTENLGCWRDSIGRCAFDLEGEGSHKLLEQDLEKNNWRGGLQGGRARRIMLSAPRSYVQNRIPQILRHISRLIYYVLKGEGIDPVEVETMYWKNKNTLFISANDPKSLLIFEKMTTKKRIANIMLEAKNHLTKFPRYDQKKINTTYRKMMDLFKPNSNRMQKWPDINKNIAEKIISLLNTVQPKFLQVPNRSISMQNYFSNGSIYIVHPTRRKINNTFAHAELWFTYIIQNKLQHLTGEEIWIYGKKRPCFTCYSQLQHMAEECLYRQHGITLHFNPHPGKMWYGQGKLMTSACLQNAQDILPCKTSYITTRGGKQYPDYDTDSDSDCEA